MKPVFSFLLILFTAAANAQEVKNQFAFGPEIAFPTGYFGRSYSVGVGSNLRLLLAVNKTGQVGITSGYTSFSAKGSTDQIGAKYAVIPVLLGYRHFVNTTFCLEPQAGIGFYNLRVRYLGIKESNTETAFTWAMGAGFYANGFELGVRFQSGLTEAVKANQVVLRLNYHLNLKN
mgnify:CR=1 FL=1